MSRKPLRFTAEETRLIEIVAKYCFTSIDVLPEARVLCAESFVLVMRPMLLTHKARQDFLTAFVNASADLPY